ncbi:hypothetical protein Tco_0794525 [Tanacetum coccineum]
MRRFNLVSELQSKIRVSSYDHVMIRANDGIEDDDDNAYVISLDLRSREPPGKASQLPGTPLAVWLAIQPSGWMVLAACRFCQARVVKCYNCQGEVHMARQCTKPKRPRNSAWFKEKMLLVQAQNFGQVFDEEQLAFLADLRVVDVQVTQTTIPLNFAFQTDDLDAYDPDYDDISSVKAVLMANLSSYDSGVLSEMSKQMSNHVTNWDNVNQETKTVNESLTAELERYKERVKTFKQRLNVDLSSRENELNEVKTGFNQWKLLLNIVLVMHANSVHVNVLLANHKCLVDGNLESERLKQENDHLFELLLSQDIVHICVNSLATLTNYAKMEQDYIDEYSENLVLKAELAKKEQMVAPPNNAKVIAPGMFKLDLEPLSPKVLNNTDAHVDYIKHTQENANILQELVEHAKALRPLDSDLDSACKYAKRIKENEEFY